MLQKILGLKEEKLVLRTTEKERISKEKDKRRGTKKKETHAINGHQS